MIKAVIMLDDDTRVFEAYFIHPPRVGEYLWATTSSSEDVRARHGVTAFLVKEVAHWCVPGYAPNAPTDVIHKLAIYVDPIRETEDKEALYGPRP
jgi:hypothetical protein